MVGGRTVHILDGGHWCSRKYIDVVSILEWNDYLFLLCYCKVLLKWEFFIQMRASYLPLSFRQKRGATEMMGAKYRPFSSEWKALDWEGRHCIYDLFGQKTPWNFVKKWRGESLKWRWLYLESPCLPPFLSPPPPPLDDPFGWRTTYLLPRSFLLHSMAAPTASSSAKKATASPEVGW